ncbi:hypothetical protein [Anaerobaca lacustris]|uniref:Uncharacterized protein n=1 Tax=Anaerobaca lacustris TaxID=3044600 RepID=A0AAW6TXX8_9BACT|nr:hypothetical protein [Sedimentisphaerales bacterium M17dextr]
MSDTKAEAFGKLCELRPPDPSCDRRTYEKHVMGWLAGSSVSLADIAEMCKYFECSCEELVYKIVKDAFGKG